MARPFAYNPSGSVISGCTQVGSIAVGVDNQDYSINPGGVFWWNGPSETNGFIIAKPIASGNQPNSINRITGNGQTASIAFNRSSALTEVSFLNLVQSVFGQSFVTGSNAKDWLNQNGYWTSYDSDVAKFIETTGITNDNQKLAIFKLVQDLKNCGMWQKLYAFYPLVGTTLNQFSYNLIDTTQYQITWNGSPTITGGNIEFNGTSQYGDTNFSPTSVPGFSMDDVSYGCYDATGFNSRTEVPMGITENSGFTRIRAVWFNTNNNIMDIWQNNDTNARVLFFSSQSVGNWIFERSSSSSSRVVYSGSIGDLINRGTNTNNTSLSGSPTNRFFLGASSGGNAGANTPELHSNKTYKYFFIGKSFDPSGSNSQMKAFSDAVYNFLSNSGK